MGAGPSVNNTIGAALVGWGVSSLVFGILCIQVWRYYQQYPKDSLAYKYLVAGILALEAIHQAFIGHAVWYYVVQNFGLEMVFLQPPIWTLSTQVALGALVGAIVKICFGMRVWKFSKHNYAVTFVIMGMALAQFGTAVAFTAKAFNTRLVRADRLRNIGSASLALGAATDILTAAALSYFLHKMRTGYSRSDTLINRLILYSVNTGAVTSACSIAVLIMYNYMPENFIYMSTYFVLCKLYANSCVSTLNSRRFVRGKGTDREEVTGPTFLMVGNPFTRSRAPDDKPQLHTPLEVGVHHEVSITSDAGVEGHEYAKAW